MTSTQDKLTTSLEICYQKIVPVENTDIHRHWLFHILLLSSEAVCDSSNSSFSPFLSLFCLSCPLLLSSHGPWPWLHVKPDTPHSLFSHHAVTSSAHHTALAMASLYLSLSLCILSVLHVCRFGICSGTQVGIENRPAEEKQEALWGDVKVEGGWRLYPLNPPTVQCYCGTESHTIASNSSTSHGRQTHPRSHDHMCSSPHTRTQYHSSVPQWDKLRQTTFEHSNA